MLGNYIKKRILKCRKKKKRKRKLKGLAKGVKSLQMAWRLFGDILEALKKCIPHVNKDLRKGKRMLVLLNSKMKQIVKARRHPLKS